MVELVYFLQGYLVVFLQLVAFFAFLLIVLLGTCLHHFQMLPHGSKFLFLLFDFGIQFLDALLFHCGINIRRRSVGGRRLLFALQLRLIRL